MGAGSNLGLVVEKYSWRRLPVSSGTNTPRTGTRPPPHVDPSPWPSHTFTWGFVPLCPSRTIFFRPPSASTSSGVFRLRPLTRGRPLPRYFGGGSYHAAVSSPAIRIILGGNPNPALPARLLAQRHHESGQHLAQGPRQPAGATEHAMRTARVARGQATHGPEESCHRPSSPGKDRSDQPHQNAVARRLGKRYRGHINNGSATLGKESIPDSSPVQLVLPHGIRKSLFLR
jgi:hypothetical protein